MLDVGLPVSPKQFESLIYTFISKEYVLLTIYKNINYYENYIINQCLNYHISIYKNCYYHKIDTINYNSELIIVKF